MFIPLKEKDQAKPLFDNLLPQYWNQGYATEITKGLIKYAFECLEFERIEALALQINKASCKVLEKSGFQLEGILRNFNRCEHYTTKQ